MYAPGRGLPLQYGNATSSGAGAQAGTSRSQSSAFTGGFPRKSAPFSSTSSVKLTGPPTSPSSGVAPRALNRSAPQPSSSPSAQRPQSRGASGTTASGPARARGNSASRNNAVQGRSAVYSTGSASTSGVPARSPLQTQRTVQHSPSPVQHSSPQLTSQRSPATPSRNEWRGTRPPAQSAASKLAGGYPSSASKKQMPATPTLNNHRTPLDNHRTPATSSQGARSVITRSVGSPTVSSSRLRSPADSRDGLSAAGSAATPSLIAARTPKASGSPGVRSKQQTTLDPGSEVAATCESRQQRGGPLLEESNVLLKFRSDEATEKAADPQNIVARFYHEASLNVAAYAALAVTPRMDVHQYWEKRRVQNVLRRVLEAIQERFALDTDSHHQDFTEVFNKLMQNTGPRKASTESQQDGLQEAHFVSELARLSLWPPELSPEDRTEIFHALLVPSVASARTVLKEGKSTRPTLTLRVFKEGFANVPFNLPDFPVPTHLMANNMQKSLDLFTSAEKEYVMEAVARTFCLEKTGVDKVKDFFICGLLSLEEIQMGLPRLFPHTLVQDAIKRVIQRGAPLMSAQEWSRLVLDVRTPQACGQAVAEESNGAVEPSREAAVLSSPLPSPGSQSRAVNGGCAEAMYGLPNLGTPALQFRETRETPSVDLHDACEAETLSLKSPQTQVRDVPHEGRVEAEMDAGLSRIRGRFEPVTEPLPCRNVRNEEPVNFSVSGSANSGSGGLTRIVNWSTAASSPEQGIVNHQADQGAGSRHSWGTRCFKQECAEAASKSSGVNQEVLMPGGADPVAWINLELHHECGGPYLAHAFVRCCQLYMDSRKRG